MFADTAYYDGIRLEHTQSEIDAIFEFLVNYKIFAMVELGVHEGGLAYAVMNEFPKMPYLAIGGTQPVCNATLLRMVGNKRAELVAGNCLSSAVVTRVDEWISEKWPVFIYCDNKDKINTLKKYKYIIRFGDFIGIHDCWIRGRSIIDLPLFPEEPRPEILEEDLKHMRSDFQSIKFESLSSTRIAIYHRKAK